MTTALFIGTFNPIHNGHLMIANYVLNNANVDKVLFIPSPDAPFKYTGNELADFSMRCNMIELSICDIENRRMSYSYIEEMLSRPTYTYNTVKKLQELSYNVEFSLIVGADNVKQLDSWYKIDELLSMVNIIVIPRGNIDCEKEINSLENKYNVKNIKILHNCPLSNLSSTFIRREIRQGKTINFYVPDKVRKFIVDNKLWRD